MLLTKCVGSNRYIESENKVEKLNVNKYLFCVKKRGNSQYFLNSSMKILKILKYLIINRNVCRFWSQ